MARVKVDVTALQQFLDAGHSREEAALHFGVSQAAISQRVKQARIATSKVVARTCGARGRSETLGCATPAARAGGILDQLTWAE